MNAHTETTAGRGDPAPGNSRPHMVDHADLQPVRKRILGMVAMPYRRDRTPIRD